MTWVKLDDSHQDHPKVAPLSDRAYRLWVRSIAHSNRFGLDGDITASQIRQVSGAIMARKRHQNELVVAGLWHETDTGMAIHDISDYQPTRKTPDEISKVRSEAGKKGAAARWQTGGNLPLAKNAPVPIPSRPVPSPEIDLSNSENFDQIQDDQELTATEIEQACFPRYGQLGSTNALKISRLCPIFGWELKHAVRNNGRSWGYFAKVITSLREEAAKPKPLAGARKSKSSITPEFVAEMTEIGRKQGAFDGRK